MQVFTQENKVSMFESIVKDWVGFGAKNVQLLKKAAKESGLKNVVFSITTENEALIYTKSNDGTYHNLIIDEDGYVCYMCIPEMREDTFSEMYAPKLLDVNLLIDKLKTT